MGFENSLAWHPSLRILCPKFNKLFHTFECLSYQIEKVGNTTQKSLSPQDDFIVKINYPDDLCAFYEAVSLVSANIPVF